MSLRFTKLNPVCVYEIKWLINCRCPHLELRNRCTLETTLAYRSVCAFKSKVKSFSRVEVSDETDFKEVGAV